MTGSKPTDSRQTFILNIRNTNFIISIRISLMIFLIHNLAYFTFNSFFHSINTRRKLQLHTPFKNVASYQKGVYYMSIKTFHALAISFAESVTNKMYFMSALEKYLIDQSYYSVDEYLLTDIRIRFRMTG